LYPVQISLFVPGTSITNHKWSG